MDVAIMQPYFFPYVAYYQLMGAVDVFVIHDDVQYIKGGWINRNRVRCDQFPAWLTIPVLDAPHESAINQRHFDLDRVDSVCRRLLGWYSGATWRKSDLAEVVGLIKEMGPNVAVANQWLLERMAERFGLKCRIVRSSALGLSHLKGQDKVVEICRSVGARRYVNPIGGLDLYEDAVFEGAGLELRFLRTLVPPTDLPSGPAHLSIVDRLVSEGVDGCSRVMDRFELICQKDGDRGCTP